MVRDRGPAKAVGCSDNKIESLTLLDAVPELGQILPDISKHFDGAQDCRLHVYDRKLRRTVTLEQIYEDLSPEGRLKGKFVFVSPLLVHMHIDILTHLYSIDLHAHTQSHQANHFTREGEGESSEEDPACEGLSGAKADAHAATGAPKLEASTSSV